MDNLLANIIIGGFYVLAGAMSLILILSIFVFVKYAMNRLLAVFISVIVIVIFLTGITAIFNNIITITRLYA